MNTRSGSSEETLTRIEDEQRALAKEIKELRALVRRLKKLLPELVSQKGQGQA